MHVRRYADLQFGCITTVSHGAGQLSSGETTKMRGLTRPVHQISLGLMENVLPCFPRLRSELASVTRSFTTSFRTPWQSNATLVTVAAAWASSRRVTSVLSWVNPSMFSVPVSAEALSVVLILITRHHSQYKTGLSGKESCTLLRS